MNNRRWNCKNPHQGNFKKVLVVCSAGLLRSPTAALVLSQKPYNYNTRAAGLDTSHALIPVDEVLLEWADLIVCMTNEQESRLRELTDKPIANFQIGDSYSYRDKELVKLIKERAKLKLL